MQLFWSLILFFVFVGTYSEPSGNNVCIKEIDRRVYVTKKVEQKIQIHTTVPCNDVTQGFQCTVTRNGTKTVYKVVPEIRKRNVTLCCDGYIEIKEKCLSVEHLKLEENKNKIKHIFGVAAMAFGIGIMIAVLGVTVFYYRKNNRKEKVPVLSTISHQPPHPTKSNYKYIPLKN